VWDFLQPLDSTQHENIELIFGLRGGNHSWVSLGHASVTLKKRSVAHVQTDLRVKSFFAELKRCAGR
jgi:hypothetical protein